jgi:hypothetical protein
LYGKRVIQELGDYFRFADEPAVTEPAIPSSGLLNHKQTAPLASENSVAGRTLARSESI